MKLQYRQLSAHLQVPRQVVDAEYRGYRLRIEDGLHFCIGVARIAGRPHSIVGVGGGDAAEAEQALREAVDRHVLDTVLAVMKQWPVPPAIAEAALAAHAERTGLRVEVAA